MIGSTGTHSVLIGVVFSRAGASLIGFPYGSRVSNGVSWVSNEVSWVSQVSNEVSWVSYVSARSRRSVFF